MYFIEFLIKKIKEIKKPLNPPNQIEIDYESCEHIFMPIDSTNQTFSCIHCGFLLKK